MGRRRRAEILAPPTIRGFGAVRGPEGRGDTPKSMIFGPNRGFGDVRAVGRRVGGGPQSMFFD